MNEPGVKLTTYFSERQRSGDRFLADALFDLYERHRMRTSVLLRGTVGFGQQHHLHTERSLTLSESLPVVSIAVDARVKVEAALGELTEVVGHGLITLERARLLTGPELRGPKLSQNGERAVKLTLYGGRAARTEAQAGYVAAIDLLRARGVAGASVLLGVDGTLHGERRRARFFARNANVPLMLFAVGEQDTMADALPRLAELIDDPVATVEQVQVCKSGGALFAAPDSVPGQDPSGLPIDVKLTVHVQEQATYGRRPLYVELIQRLRESAASGATVLRGVRGFYGDHAPFADRFLSLRRNVPVHIEVVDRPQTIERLWPIVDEVTREQGIVTSEIVPASHVFGTGEPRLQLASTPTARESW